MNNYEKIVGYLEKTKIYNKELVIPGWFNINDILCFYLISSLQKINGINGNATEIGVHYGKCSIFLSNLYYDKVYSVDLFEDNQSENVSNSGDGNLKIFKSLLEKYGTTEKVNIIVKNSLNLVQGDVEDNTLFHIDGGHSFNEVMSDLNYAYSTMKKGGVVVLDDAFSFRYPDVSMAVALFLNKNKNLVPFLITAAKIYLCEVEYFDFYYSLFSNDENLKAFGLSRSKGHATTFMNNKVVILNNSENVLFKNDCNLIKLFEE